MVYRSDARPGAILRSLDRRDEDRQVEVVSSDGLFAQVRNTATGRKGQIMLPSTSWELVHQTTVPSGS